jgi:hypothetical protein
VADLLNLSEQGVTNFDVCQIILLLFPVRLLLQPIPQLV